MTIKDFPWFGRMSIAERARRKIAEHERDLYDEQEKLAACQTNINHFKAEIKRLEKMIPLDVDGGSNGTSES